MEVDDISGVDDSFCIDFGVPDSLIEYSEEHLSSEDNTDQDDFQIEGIYDKSEELMEEERLENDEIDETVLTKTEQQKRSASVQVLRPKTTAMSGPPLIRNIGVQQQSLSQQKLPVKIAAKSNTTATTKSSGGQILIIQSPNGTQQTIRLSGANAQNLSSGGYQLIKTPEGNLIQIRKKNNQSNLKELVTPPETIKRIITQQQKPSTSNASGKLIYKGINVKGNEQHVMLSTAPTKLPATIVTSTNGTTTTQTKTLSLNDVQQLRLMNSGTAVKQVIVTHKGKDGLVQNLRTVPRTVSSGQNSPNTPSPRVLTNAIKKITPIQPKLPISTTLTKTAPIIKKASLILNILSYLRLFFIFILTYIF